MDSVIKIVLEIVAGIGGIGVIFSAVVGFCSSQIAEKLQNKYQLKLDETLEKYKATLTNKIYISQTKFDAEFAIYKSLSDAFAKCVKAFNVLIPAGLAIHPADKEKKKELDEKNFGQAVSAYSNAQDELDKSIPFISEDIVEGYIELLKMCNQQIFDFQERWNVSYIGTEEEKSSLSDESYNRTTQINKLFKEQNMRIRDYLNKLDVL